MFSSKVCPHGTVYAVLLMMLFFAAPAPAQQNSGTNGEQVQVDRIRFEGIRVWSRSDMREVLQEAGLREGTILSRPTFQSRVSQSVERLYHEGLFSDIQARLEGSTLIFEVEEHPQVSNLVFRGNESRDQKTLRDVLLLQRGEPASEDAIEEARRQLKQYYRSEGFGDAIIETKIEEAVSGRVVIIFEIDEGDRERIGGVYLEYVDGKSVFSEIGQNWKLRWSIPLKEGDPYSPERLRRVNQIIEQWYHNRGYLDVKIETKTRPLTRDRGLELTFLIEEGPIYQLGSVTIANNEILSNGELRELIPLRQGDIFNRQKMVEGLQAMENRYQDRGYANASIFDPSRFRIKRDEDNLRAHVEVRVFEGQPFYVEQIELSGNEVTYDKVIMREISLKEDELLDGEKMRNSRRRLRNLGFFESVEMNVDPGSKENTKIVRIRVRERATGELSFGGGFSSSTGFIGSLSVSKDNFSLYDWSNGFTGRGQRISISAQLGSRQDNFNVSWDDPWINDDLDNPDEPSPDVPVSFGWSAFNTNNERTEEFNEIRRGGSVRLGREFGSALSNKFDVEYSFRSIDVEGLEDADNPPETFEDEAALAGDSDGFTRKIGSLTLGLQRDRRDDRRFPSEGYFLRGTTETAWEGFGGNSNFYKPQLDSRMYIPFWRELFWAWQLNYKTVDSWEDDPAEIPSFEEFFLGGQRDVRGYESNEIAIYDSSGNKLGGGQSAIFSKLELRLQLIEETMQGFLFTDMGQVASDAWELETSDVKASAGLGFRVRSPIGPINISWGQRLKETYPTADDKGEVQMDFSIGTGF